MKEAVEGGAGHDRIAGKDVSPFGEGLIGSDDGSSVLFVAVADHLEEHGRTGVIETEITHFIDD
jgi:hypothetical protein